MTLPWPLAPTAQYLQQLVSAITAGWSVEHTGDGLHDWHEQNIPYSAGRFSGDTSTWTVDGNEVIAYRCARLGSMMHLSFRVQSSDVGSGNQALRVALPDGYRVAGYAHGTLNYVDAGATTDVGICVAVPDTRFISCYTRTVANWTATTSDNTVVQGSILFPVAQD